MLRRSTRFASILLLAGLTLPLAAQPAPVKAPPKPISATKAETMKVAKGFKVELLYSVPKEVEGSWVCMTNLPDGRLVVSDQYDKGMYIVTPPKLGTNDGVKVEPMGLNLSMAVNQGPSWHGLKRFDANSGRLYEVEASGIGCFFGGNVSPPNCPCSPRDEGCQVSTVSHGMALKRHFGDEFQFPNGVIQLMALSLPRRACAGLRARASALGPVNPTRIIPPP